MDSLFKSTFISATELRASAKAFDSLISNPMIPIAVQRHSRTEGILVSEMLWDLLCATARGRAMVFSVPTEDANYDKQVLAKLEKDPDAPEGSRFWTVMIDEMPYHLHQVGEDTSPDMSQTIWRHHPNVAKAIVGRWVQHQQMLDA